MTTPVDASLGGAQYGGRCATAEPGFANLRHHERLDRLTLRGRAKFDAQSKLYGLVHHMRSPLQPFTHGTLALNGPVHKPIAAVRSHTIDGEDHSRGSSKTTPCLTRMTSPAWSPRCWIGFVANTRKLAS